MTTADWIVVAAAIVGGVVLGLFASRLLNSFLGAPARPEPLRQAAGPLSSLGFWTFVIIGLLVALGVLSPSSLEQLPKDVIAFLPRLLSAAILLILANVVSEFATAAIRPMLGRASASVQRQAVMAVKALIVGMATILAVRQLGIDTTVINLAVAALFFGVAGSLTLLIGLGGRRVAHEVSATRAIKRLVATGDRVTVGEVNGEVIAIHPTAVELRAADASVQLVPSSLLLSETITVVRNRPADSE